MQVSQAYIQAFVQQMDALNAQAGRTIVTEAKKLNLEQQLLAMGDVSFEDLYRIMASVYPTYAKLASALTCHFYDGIRQGFNVPGEFKAEAYETVSKGSLISTARRMHGEIESGKNTVTPMKLLIDEATYRTRYASNETMRRNALRDPAHPRFAIVPGPGACAFCLMRASNGYVYPEAVEIESHKNCNCQAVQVYGNSTIQGYNPGEYADQYYEAKDALQSGRISDALQRRIDEAAEKNPEFTETNAILMVWREQQGIK